MTTNETETLPAVVGERPMPDASIALGNGTITPEDWGTLKAIAMTVANTEFVPAGLRNSPPKIMAALLYGREQGLQPMASLAEIHIIDGKPSLSAAIQTAKIRAAGHSVRREVIRDADGNIVGARAIGKRNDAQGDEDEYEFTIDMARRAGLLGKKNWQNYPEAMCWARAVSQLATFLFSDIFMGSPYTAEELGDDTDITTQEAQAIPEPEEAPEPIEDADVVPGPPLSEEKGETDEYGNAANAEATVVEVLTSAAEAGLPLSTAAKLEHQRQRELEATGKLTTPNILELAVGKPPEWIRAVLDYEKGKQSPRKGLVERLEAMYATVSAPAEPEPAAQVEPDAEPLVPFEQGDRVIVQLVRNGEHTEDIGAVPKGHVGVVFDDTSYEITADVAGAEAAFDAQPIEGDVVEEPTGVTVHAEMALLAETDERKLEPGEEPFEPSADPEPEVPATVYEKLEAGLAYMAKNKPQHTEWKTNSVLVTASKMWGEITEITDLTEEQATVVLDKLVELHPDAAA